MRAATPADARTLAPALARAFSDDPLWIHLAGSAEAMAARSAPMFAATARSRVRSGLVVCHERHQGGAIWAPPGRWRADAAMALRAGLATVRLLRTRTVAGARFLAALERHHPREPHWYLELLGTDPDAQGQGIGAAAMAPVLTHCDRHGIGAYLESSKEANLAYYTRHGFVAGKALELAGAPPMWPMWRDPRPPEDDDESDEGDHGRGPGVAGR